MDERLKNGLTKLINKHHAAVQTDTELEHTDNWKLEKKARLFWDQYNETHAEFVQLLEKCVIQ